MKAIDPKVTFTDADYYAPGITTKHMFFTGAHGARIHANYACPEKTDGETPCNRMVSWICRFGCKLSFAASLLQVSYKHCITVTLKLAEKNKRINQLVHLCSHNQSN